MIIKMKTDEGSEWLLNTDHIIICRPINTGGYHIWFRNGPDLKISYKEYNLLSRAADIISID